MYNAHTRIADPRSLKRVSSVDYTDGLRPSTNPIHWQSMYTYIYIYVYTHVHKYVYVYIYMCTDAYTSHVYKQVNMHMCMYMSIYMSMQLYARINIWICVACACIRTWRLMLLANHLLLGL